MLKNIKIHMICGSTGAGKTTFARELSKSLSAVRFSIDEWMNTLFWMDAPASSSFEWALERVHRCETMIMKIALQCHQSQQIVVLDLGFSETKQRHMFYQWAKTHKLQFELIYLDVPADLRWKRIQKRNQETLDFSISVSKETFDWMEGYFVPPTDAELEHGGGKLITRSAS